jgi:sulfur carrier protein
MLHNFDRPTSSVSLPLAADEFDLAPVGNRASACDDPRSLIARTAEPIVAPGPTSANRWEDVVRIQVNGECKELPDGATVRSLLESLDVKTKAVAVERNLEIVPQSQHGECLLTDGDRLEIVTLVGGG